MSVLGTQALQTYPTALGDEIGVLGSDVDSDEALDEEDSAPQPMSSKADAAKIRAFVIEHHGFVWRALIRLGVPRADAEDALQQVFIVASRKFAAILPGCEKAFLYGTSMRVASRARRTKDRRRETGNEPCDERVDPHAAGPEELLDRARARVLLDKILHDMPLELRSVFTLYELEQMTMAEIAEMLSVPPGTVASRLRRAREIFTEQRKRIERELTKKERV